MPVVRVAAGNALEMYDFQIFGYYAAAIAATFFPSGHEFASLMLALATFGAGFLMRPLGAIVLGAYIDHRGRRAGLLLTLALMGFGTLAVACLPGYAVLGLAAPLLVLVGPSGAGIFGGRRTGRRLRLPFRDRAAQSQGILCELAIRQPASGRDVRRAARHRADIHALEQSNVALGMARRASGRLCAASLAAFLAPLARRDQPNFSRAHDIPLRPTS